MTTRDATGYSVLTLIGDLDADNGPELRAAIDALTAAGAARLVIDLAPLHYVTTAGLRAIAEAHRACHHAGIDLVLADAQPRVFMALTLTDLTDYMTCYDTVPGAGSANRDDLRSPSL